jgi:hypothetical protein
MPVCSLLDLLTCWLLQGLGAAAAAAEQHRKATSTGTLHHALVQAKACVGAADAAHCSSTVQ